MAGFAKAEKINSEFEYEICNSRMKPLAEQLVKKFTELRHIDIDKILFVVNHKSAGGDKKHVILAHTSKISPKWTEVLYQLGACSYFYMIEFYAKTTASLDESQMVALLYSQLRRIDGEGKIRTPDVHDWWQIIAGLGRKWFYPNETCPNLLDEGVDWKKLMGQFYEEIPEEDVERY